MMLYVDLIPLSIPKLPCNFKNVSSSVPLVFYYLSLIPEKCYRD